MTDVSQATGTKQGSGQSAEQVESAVSQGTAYEVIRKRLSDQGNQLETLAQNLNQARLQEFGSTELNIIGRTRVRTDNNCLARDIVRVGDYLLFGYNVCCSCTRCYICGKTYFSRPRNVGYRSSRFG